MEANNMEIKILRKPVTLVSIIILLTLSYVTAVSSMNVPLSYNLEKGITYQIKGDISLPPPQDIEMVLEETIFRRCSIREFTLDPVTEQDLSTILWAAYGFRNDGTRTIHLFDSSPAVNMYVLIRNESMSIDVYSYKPFSHSLQYIKKISALNFGQYVAPVYLGLVWDTNKSDNEYLATAEMGMIGQNIAFAANALELGTVVNGEVLPWANLAKVGLPPNELPYIIMPLGHPEFPYNFRYRPLDFSFLPRIQYSEMSFTEALTERKPLQSWQGELTDHEQYQIIWSTYGFSYLLDRMKSEFIYHIGRHRTVPSAHGYYPLHIYTFTDTAVSQYHANILLYLTPSPLIDFLGLPMISVYQKIKQGDYRDDLAQICSRPQLSDAPLSIVFIVDLDKTRPEGGDDFSGEDFQWLWYYESAAAGFNALLEATAWGLTSDFYPIENKNEICDFLALDREIFDPLFILPVGE
jgi:nitroreductase